MRATPLAAMTQESWASFEDAKRAIDAIVPYETRRSAAWSAGASATSGSTPSTSSGRSLYGGQPRLHEEEVSRNPLGPLQGWGEGVGQTLLTR